MKFPRNAKIFRGQFDAAPFAGVFFILVIFVLLSSRVYTPGVRIELPASRQDWPGVQGPRAAVAVGPNGQLYFENRLVQMGELKRRLQEAMQSSPHVTLVVLYDTAVPHGTEQTLRDLAMSLGIKEVVEQTRPRLYDTPQADRNLTP